MVERLESHISCMKKSDRVRKVSTDFWREALTLPWRYIELSLLSQMEARKQKYGISSLTKFHFQSYFYEVSVSSAHMNNSWNIPVYSLL